MYLEISSSCEEMQFFGNNMKLSRPCEESLGVKGSSLGTTWKFLGREKNVLVLNAAHWKRNFKSVRRMYWRQMQFVGNDLEISSPWEECIGVKCSSLGKNLEISSP